MSSAHETTAYDFEQFRRHCERWISLLGLKDWEIYYSHRAEDPEEYEAWCMADFEARSAELGLNTEQSSPVTPEFIENCALHEVLELLLAPMDMLARRRDYDASTFTAERHAAVRRLERAFRNQ